MKSIEEPQPTMFGENIKFGKLLAQFDNAAGWVGMCIYLFSCF